MSGKIASFWSFGGWHAQRAITALVIMVGSVSIAFAQAPEKPKDAPAAEANPSKVQPLAIVKTGTSASESAATHGLKWLVEQQEMDGGWNLGGNLNGARSAATGLAVLAILGSGNNPKEGLYKTQVAAGVKFLEGRGKESENGKAILEPGGSMYGHGIATWALCEAYAATGDKDTKAAAEQALKYLIFAQDPIGGGWRYAARQPGDMSVTGWQLSALRAAQLGGLEIPPETFAGAKRFLDQLESNQGEGYGYTTPSVGMATTAEGLLGRIYLGTKPDDKKLQPGFATLVKFGPGKNNAYYRFFGTQAIFHHGGDDWKQWHGTVRDFLVESQDKEPGKNRGSWLIENDQFGANLGRLYQTSLAILTLEVEYTYLAVLKDK